jgi:hypothetical protein
MLPIQFDTHFPDYEVLAEIGESSKRVFKAQHLPTGDLVIMDEYALAPDANTRQRLEQELQKLIHVSHPNLVRVRELQFAENTAYVVLDYTEASHLRTLLQEKGFLDIPTTIRLGLQLTGAFRAMHTSGVVHQAISPETIVYNHLISGELHFLLTGLGIVGARTWTDRSGRTLIDHDLINYEYAAPEQFDDTHQVDEAVDYYALGAILYECLAGAVPFALHSEGNLAQFKQQVLNAPIPAMTTASGHTLPPSLTTLLMGLLVRNPQDRLRNVDQLELLLEQSRVELLNATWSVPAMSADKAIPAGTTTETAVTAALVEEGKPASGGSRKNWWVEIGIVLLVMLAFGFYYRTAHKSPNEPVIEKESETHKAADRSKAGTKLADTTMESDRQKKGEGREGNAAADSAIETTDTRNPLKRTTDSSSSVNPEPDSSVVVQPDSTD